MVFIYEKAGVISEGRCWVTWHQCWMYMGDTLEEVLWQIYNEWEHDKHLCM